MGDTAQALARNALAIGTNAQAAGVSSGAIGTQNRVTGANTYVLGSQNSTAATGTAADVSASNSGIFGNENRMEGDSNRIVGNSNKVEKASMAQSGSTTPKKLEDIMVTGNGNVVSGDPDTATARDAGDVTGITVTGSKNKVVAKNNKGKNLTDIQIVGNNNEIDTSDKDRDLSNTQILGSNVKATLGNSTYIGSGSAYVVSGTTTRNGNILRQRHLRLCRRYSRRCCHRRLRRKRTAYPKRGIRFGQQYQHRCRQWKPALHHDSASAVCRR